jgi:hypothetical protein
MADSTTSFPYRVRTKLFADGHDGRGRTHLQVAQVLTADGTDTGIERVWRKNRDGSTTSFVCEAGEFPTLAEAISATASQDGTP